MTDLKLPIPPALALVPDPSLFWRALREVPTRPAGQNTPGSDLHATPPRRVALGSNDLRRSQMIGPRSGRACAYWEVDIAVRGRNRGSWSTVHRNASGSPFFIQDESGVALVYPHGAECKVRFGTDEECYGLNLPEVYAAYLKEHSSLGG